MFAQQRRRQDVTGEDEEDLDPEEAAGEQSGGRVVREHTDERDASNAVQRLNAARSPAQGRQRLRETKCDPSRHQPTLFSRATGERDRPRGGQSNQYRTFGRSGQSTSLSKRLPLRSMIGPGRAQLPSVVMPTTWNPPSTYNVWPVTWLERSLARYTADRPTSSIVMLALIGAMSGKERYIPLNPVTPMAAIVRTGPALIAFTRIPSGPRSVGEVSDRCFERCLRDPHDVVVRDGLLGAVVGERHHARASALRSGRAAFT